MSSAGLDSSDYVRSINERLNDLNMNQVLATKYTMTDQYSGLMGGSRKRQYLQSGNTPYEIMYPETLGIIGGASFGKRINHLTKSGVMVSPTNMLYPSVFMNNPVMKRAQRQIGAGMMQPMAYGGYNTPETSTAGVGGRRGYKKGSMSLTHPSELDFTTKRGSRVHHIAGHYVNEPIAPYQRGGKINFKKIGRSISHAFKPIGKALAPVAKQVLPTLGATLGSMAGESLGAIDPALIPVGQQLGSQFGRNIGSNIASKIGGVRKSKKGVTSRQQIVKQVMQQQGLSLPQASKYVKEHGLY